MRQLPSLFNQRGLLLYNSVVDQRLSLRSGAAAAIQLVERTHVVKVSKLQGFVMSRPFRRMQMFASWLGWRGLQIFDVAPWPEAFESHKGLDRLYFYQTPDRKFFLNINEVPGGQSFTHRATIRAERYGIAGIDGIHFALYDDIDRLRIECHRLLPMLSRNNWKSRSWRKQRMDAPDVSLWPSKKKIRGKCRSQSSAAFGRRNIGFSLLTDSTLVTRRDS